jgi:hypothetical protein
MWRVALAFAIVLAAVGCGGSGRLSKRDYAKQADAICAKYNAKLRAIDRPRRIAELPQYVDRALPVARRGTDELRSLEAPKDEERTAREWLDQNHVVVAAMERLREAAKRNDRGGIEVALSEGNAANRAANQLARKLGLRVCARG